MNHLKTLTDVSMETKVVSADSFLDKLSQNFTSMDSEKGNRVFSKGMCHTPLVFGAQKAWMG